MDRAIHMDRARGGCSRRMPVQSVQSVTSQCVKKGEDPKFGRGEALVLQQSLKNHYSSNFLKSVTSQCVKAPSGARCHTTPTWSLPVQSVQSVHDQSFSHEKEKSRSLVQSVQSVQSVGSVVKSYSGW